MAESLSKKIKWLSRQYRDYRKVVPFTSAWRLLLSNYRQGNTRFRIRSGRRLLTIRNRTSDLACFSKIFCSDEYRMPFDLEPRFIVDAGANIGMATAYFAGLYPDAKIVAIEPNASNFEVLKRNTAENSNVSLVQGALWPEHRPISIKNASAAKWAFMVTEDANSASTPPFAETVIATTVPDILERFKVERIDLLKIDIEGAELELFSRGAKAWLDSVGAIVIELHDRLKPGCSEAFYSALAGRRFRQESRGEDIFIELAPRAASVDEAPFQAPARVPGASKIARSS